MYDFKNQVVLVTGGTGYNNDGGNNVPTLTLGDQTSGKDIENIVSKITHNIEINPWGVADLGFQDFYQIYCIYNNKEYLHEHLPTDLINIQ